MSLMSGAARARAARSLSSVLSGPTGLTVLANFALMGLGLLTGSLGAHLLGPTGRGQLAAIQLWPLALAGLGSAGLMDAAAYFSGRCREQGAAVIITVLGMLCLLAVPLTIGGILAVPYALKSEPGWVVREAQWYMLYVPVAFLVAPPLAALRGSGDLRLWNVLRLTIPTGYFAILLLSGLLHVDRVTFVAFGLLGWTAAHVALTMWLLFVRLPGRRRFQRNLVRPLARFGTLSVGASAPAWLNVRLDQLVMGAFVPPHLLGLYVVSVTWSGAVTPLANAFSQVILPRLAQTSDLETARERLASASRIASAATLMVGAGFLIITPPAMYLLFGAAFTSAIPTAMVLVVAAVFLGMCQFLEEAIRGLGRPGLAAVAEGLGLGITLPALYLLLPRLGIFGAGLASLLAYVTVFIFLSAALRRHVGLHPSTLYVPRSRDLWLIAGKLGLTWRMEGT